MAVEHFDVVIVGAGHIGRVLYQYAETLGYEVIVIDDRKDAAAREHFPNAKQILVGDIGEAFGADHVLFRTARGLAAIAHKKELRQKLAALPRDADPKEREALEKAGLKYID